MTKAATPHRWLQGWRASEPHLRPDPADLGTAFGLELSMGNAEADVPTAEPPGARKPGWVRRLTGKRNSAS